MQKLMFVLLALLLTIGPRWQSLASRYSTITIPSLYRKTHKPMQ